MSNSGRLLKAFSESLGIPAHTITDSLGYGAGGWDSVAHMRLVAAIEGEFDIMLETDDVIGLSSFGKAKELLGKYGIGFDTAG